MQNFNELIARTVDFKPGERNVFLHLLTQCNLSCRHCYINPTQHGTTMLPTETVRQWLRLFARPERESNLILLGGEPTLHPDLAAIIRAAKALRYAVTVDSNGFLFHDLLKRVRPVELDFLSFSLDGPDAAVNDPIRGKGVFAVCTENLRQAVSLGFRTSLICTVSALNIDHLHRMPALLTQLGVQRFFIQVIGLRGNSATGGAENLQVDRAGWLEVVPETARQAARLGIHVTYPKVFLEPGESFSCAGLAAENYFVFPNGRVYRCPLCEDYPIHSFCIENSELVQQQGLNEDRFFNLSIPEGCVMNKLLQSDNLDYLPDGSLKHRISCCMLKQEMRP
ncbi:MAG: Radical SAM superfamily enzyme, MoaA/NifB/PqqE/SkfB family [Candidatus Electronema aureum]|uniref:Radical SAM superfamily enzyme, MoaA/NifB/PqqE/SkfB family n=1 Tax=Candidatus Electronema aureum TaxID=2005002 RepID=A0A521FYR7_9BACT|nr:MAG: Radical SAM superfamily enzyme, MoaA/NifB/PqqE/SkfB family [Candidatus Electronema aureum]